MQARDLNPLDRAVIRNYKDSVQIAEGKFDAASVYRWDLGDGGWGHDFWRRAGLT
jgi:hypothetical protein